MKNSLRFQAFGMYVDLGDTWPESRHDQALGPERPTLDEALRDALAKARKEVASQADVMRPLQDIFIKIRGCPEMAVLDERAKSTSRILSGCFNEAWDDEAG